MGNAARKQRRREGVKFERKEKVPTTKYVTRQERQERRRRASRTVTDILNEVRARTRAAEALASEKEGKNGDS